ncbi:hypothetical protein PTSG_09007 [Salpingoeca rosetta]|uniref:Rapamycin-insensitive companion of mTOR N-terminal domain-containing protein n=1 Tax=Salpingoeca rosetta (strain ATCC 50818 / BSB-021) TaxID=946362 RepID=F2ULY1_SALR5|nr:uncharacterized protein PTSG_09007 [Salpingoeca rosetta]EGD78130.1 hypothetical protein PTSG_09007 [Salpingoeca rosetta]|eukprot:XP_004989806.1 hypothetical protein PTSG_09007 [Salpingoeca rosetta]
MSLAAAALRRRGEATKSLRQRRSLREGVHQRVTSMSDNDEKIRAILDAILSDEETTPTDEKVHFLNQLTNLFGKTAAADALSVSGVSLHEILASLRMCLANSSTQLRAATLRCLRHFVASAETCAIAYDLGLDFFLVRSVQQFDTRIEEVERMQAMALIRQVMRLAPDDFPRTLSSCVAAVAQSPDDALRMLALELLCEMAVRAPHACCYCFGFEVMMLVVLAVIVVVVVVMMMMMVLWLVYLSGAGGIKCVLDTLTLPDIATDELQLAVIDMVYEMLVLDFPDTSETDVKKGFEGMFGIQTSFLRRENRIDLMDVYRAAVLVALLDANIIETLVSVISNVDGETVGWPATVLLCNLIHLTSRLLPRPTATSILVRETARYLRDSALLPRIASILDSTAAGQEAPLLSKRRVATTQARDYFQLIEAASSTSHGHMLLQESGVLVALQACARNKARSDLQALIARHLDILPDVPQGSAVTARKIMESLLHHGSDRVVDAVFERFWRTLSSNQDYGGCCQWTVAVLIKCLSTKHAMHALELLQRACAQDAFIEVVAEHVEELCAIKDIARPLLLRTLSHDVAYKRMSNLGFVEKELADCSAVTIITIIAIDRTAAITLRPTPAPIWRDADIAHVIRSDEEAPPRHVQDLSHQLRHAAGVQQRGRAGSASTTPGPKHAGQDIAVPDPRQPSSRPHEARQPRTDTIVLENATTTTNVHDLTTFTCRDVNATLLLASLIHIRPVSVRGLVAWRPIDFVCARRRCPANVRRVCHGSGCASSLLDHGVPLKPAVRTTRIAH